MSFLNGFLDNVVSGALNPKGTVNFESVEIAIICSYYFYLSYYSPLISPVFLSLNGM